MQWFRHRDSSSEPTGQRAPWARHICRADTKADQSSVGAASRLGAPSIARRERNQKIVPSDARRSEGIEDSSYGAWLVIGLGTTKISPLTGLRGSIAEQILQLIACLVSAELLIRRGDKYPPRQFEPFAVVREVFFLDRIGAAVATLIGHRAIVARTVQADLAVRAAVARFGATRRAPGFVFRSTLPTMPCHGGILHRATPSPSFSVAGTNSDHR